MEEQFEMFRSDLRYRRAIRDTLEQLEIRKSNPRYAEVIRDIEERLDMRMYDVALARNSALVYAGGSIYKGAN
jgi:ribosomal protein S4